MHLNSIDLTIIIPAFLTGVMVLLTHVPLGAQVLKRGIVFIDLAIAQIATLGVILAGLAGIDQGWQIQLAAGAAAILGALLLTWTEKRWPAVQEAQIGALFVLAATGGLLLLAHNPHSSEHLQNLLAGQILWVRYEQLWLPMAMTIVIAGVIYRCNEKIGQLGFYLLFAIAVTISVQLIGVYLVFASLIIPSLGVRNYPSKKIRLWLAYLVGVAGYAIGLLISLLFDFPAGALIVWSLALLALLMHTLGPSQPE